MGWALTVGIVAIFGVMVYYMRGKLNLENEKAALENSKTADEGKIQLLEQDRLAHEYQLRKKEQDALEGLNEDGDGPSFYPDRLPRDPNDLN